MQFKVDFSHITADNLTMPVYQSLFDVKPWQDLDLSVLNINVSDLDLNSRAKIVFNTLKFMPMDDFNVLDVLALITVSHDEENIVNLNKVSAHWLESALNHNHALNATLIFLFSLIQTDETKNHIANQALLKRLIQQIKISNKSSWKDKMLYEFVKNAMADNGKNLALLALNHGMTCKELFDKYAFGIKKSIRQTSEQEWLSAYLKSDPNIIQRHLQYNIIQRYLNQKTDVNFAIKRAKTIFDHKFFSKNLATLENQTHQFKDIFEWLKQWSANPDFMSGFDVHHLQILRCWLGAGNYYQLEKMVGEIAKINNENIQENSSISINRYIFWKNYQQHILDYYLLIPNSQKAKYYNIKDTNLKYMNDNQTNKNYNVPTILIRFRQCYFIQPLVSYGSVVDLLATIDFDLIDNSLNQTLFNSQVFSEITPCLIHDHKFLWQSDMAKTLKEDFYINMSDEKRFVITPSLIENTQKETWSKQKHKDRLKALNEWHNKSHRQDALDIYAISYHKRHERHG